MVQIVSTNWLHGFLLYDKHWIYFNLSEILQKSSETALSSAVTNKPTQFGHLDQSVLINYGEIRVCIYYIRIPKTFSLETYT